MSTSTAPSLCVSSRWATEVGSPAAARTVSRTAAQFTSFQSSLRGTPLKFSNSSASREFLENCYCGGETLGTADQKMETCDKMEQKLNAALRYFLSLESVYSNNIDVSMRSLRTSEWGSCTLGPSKRGVEIR